MWSKGIDVANHILQNYYGIKEVDGVDSNAIILDIIRWAIPNAQDDSAIAWCAISLSYFINEVCGPFPPIKLARKFQNHGKEVDIPRYGDIVVFWRASINSWKGHVGIVIRDDDDKVYTLGGNQDNQINIKAYSKSRVLKYVRL